MKGLFGQQVKPTHSIHRRVVIDMARPARLGTGPIGETCKTCRFYIRIRYHNKIYRKCKLQEKVWTHGLGTDIRAKDPACSEWNQLPERK